MEILEELFIEGKPLPLWKTVFAAFFYTLTILCIWIGIYRMMHPDLYTIYEYNGSVIIIEMSLFTLLFAIVFSIRISFLLNSKKREIFEVYNIGILSFKMKRTTDLKNLEYISVFSPDNKNSFYIMMWFENNKKEFLCGFYDLNVAFQYGEIISNMFYVDLLDATEKGNFKWVEIKK